MESEEFSLWPDTGRRRFPWDSIEDNFVCTITDKGGKYSKEFDFKEVIKSVEVHVSDPTAWKVGQTGGQKFKASLHHRKPYPKKKRRTVA